MGQTNIATLKKRADRSWSNQSSRLDTHQPTNQPTNQPTYLPGPAWDSHNRRWTGQRAVIFICLQKAQNQSIIIICDTQQTFFIAVHHVSLLDQQQKPWDIRRWQTRRGFTLLKVNCWSAVIAFWLQWLPSGADAGCKKYEIIDQQRKYIWDSHFWQKTLFRVQRKQKEATAIKER